MPAAEIERIALQKALFEGGYYPGQPDACGVPPWRYTDGSFGNASWSLQAVRNFVSRNPNHSRTPALFLTDVQRARNASNVCGPKAVAPASTCSRYGAGNTHVSRVVGSDAYLKRVLELEAALDIAIDNFNALFDPKTKLPEQLRDSDVKERFKRFGSPHIDRELTFEALQSARRRFASLAFQYGQSTDACRKCLLINDWRFLVNQAQSGAGRLFHSTRPDINIAVEDITSGMMTLVSEHIYLFRHMTQKFVSVVRSNLGSYSFTEYDQAKGQPETTTVPTSELARARLAELDEVIIRLTGIHRGLEIGKPGQLAVIPDPDKTLMRDIARDYSCEGFDGSSVFGDQ